jgi:hypothetical protein
MKTIFKIIMWPALLYLTWSFAESTFNIAKWDFADRGFCAFLLFIVSLISIVYHAYNVEK